MGVLKPGTAFAGRYEIVRILSAGGMGAVYEVIHQETRRHCALKVMLPSAFADDDIRARFRLEASVTSTVESEHIVEVLDAGVEDATGSPFLVMELLRGEDLGKRLRSRGPMSSAEAIELFTQIARGLDRTHEAGIIHRDLKPENVFLTKRDDGSLRAKILDFGIAKLISKTQGTSTRSLGTPLFMSPEQMEGIASEIGPPTDLYSLAHLAFAVLCGKAYYQPEANQADNVLSLLLHISKGSTEPATARAAAYGVRLPAAFDAWFSQSTHRDPSRRFASAGEMVRALAVALDDAQSGAAPTPPPAPPLADSADAASSAPVTSIGPSPMAMTGGAAPADTPPDPDTHSAADSRVSIAHADTILATAPQAPKPSSRAPWVIVGVGALIASGAVLATTGLLGDGVSDAALSAVHSAEPGPSQQNDTITPTRASAPPLPKLSATPPDPTSSAPAITATATLSVRTSSVRPGTAAPPPVSEILKSPDGR